MRKPGVLPLVNRKADFPLFQSSEHGSSLHYLDNAATTQKPASVIDAISDCYRNAYAPIHRGIYPLAESATASYERARATVARFIGASTAEQLIFTRSATEAINMVAWGWARTRLQPGDRIWVTRMEHHSNFLPWQRICKERHAELRIIELQEDGTLDLEAATDLFDKRTRLIALCHISNVLGSVNPIRSLCEQAAALDIPVLVDAAQSVGHMPIDVTTLGCDFLAFSAHKMYGPTGIGALYAKTERLEELEPLLLGGGMVDQVSDSHCSWTAIPARFEAGSPNLADAVGFAAAVDYLSAIGMEQVQAYVTSLTHQAIERLSQFADVRLIPAANASRSSIISFEMPGVHPHDIAQIAGERGVAVRAGHHCCQPLMHSLGLTATTRISFGLYNQQEDVEALLAAIDEVRRLFV
ncbi:MAG: SufS family cysteine desulfurase [Halobacteria archaeon]|nr:SufS family cysteine desulfurase [Halobacteria archaeon]